MHAVGLQSVPDQTEWIWVTLSQKFLGAYNLHELCQSSFVLAAAATSTASGLLSRGRVGLLSCGYTDLVYTALLYSP